VKFGIIEFDVQLSCAVFCPRYCRVFLSTRIRVHAIGSAVLSYAFLTGHLQNVIGVRFFLRHSVD